MTDDPDRDLKRQIARAALEMMADGIARARAAQGLTPETLAAQLGVQVATITGIEAGTVVPSPEMTRALYDALPTLMQEMLAIHRERSRPN